jgi:hypothetical protein
MKHFSLYRIATYLLILFCAGHTFGGMLFPKSLGPKADAVFASMKATHFNFNGADCTYYGFWFGFGLTASVFQLFSAVTAWTLGNVKPSHWASVSPIAWALFVSHVCGAALSFKYFFAGPGTFSTVIAALLGIGALLKGRAAASARSVAPETGSEFGHP